jgi:hypothetical protein
MCNPLDITLRVRDAPVVVGVRYNTSVDRQRTPPPPPPRHPPTAAHRAAGGARGRGVLFEGRV